MRTYTLAIVALVPFVGANNYISDWENTIPDCEPKQCGNKGPCDRLEVCSDHIGGMEVCHRVWPYRFCDRECPQAPGGVRMVPNPRRYCECIGAD